MNITLPDGLVDIRYITSGDSYFIDKLEFGILSEYEENITIAVRQDPATLNLSERYEVLSIGGTECGFKETGLCRRKFLGYKFRLLEREKDRVKIEVTTPEKNTLPSTWIYTTPDRIRDLEIGVVRPITLGGYATIYLKEAI